MAPRRPRAARKMATPGPKGNGLGAPLALTRVLERDPDGNPTVTVGSRFLDMIRLGNPVQIAAACAGASAYAMVQAIKDGARLSDEVEGGLRSEDALSPRERLLIDFSRDYTRASGEAIATHSAILARIVRGGGQVVTRTTVTKHVGDQIEVTETTRTEILGPDPATLRWYLERRWPEHFGTRITVATDPALDPTHRTADDAIDRVLAMLEQPPAQLGPAPIDTTAR